MVDRPAAKAYSYLRFSTPEQLKGDSFRRQSRLAEEYAKRNGLHLDTDLTFQDLGVSAFRGRNAEAGRLGDFLDGIREGVIAPGSVLLVESLDRISRQSARKAVRIVEEIVEAGVDVVTLSDGKRYTTESLDSFDFLMAVMVFIRANEESVIKGRRTKAAWDHKRSRASDAPLTARGPGWLRLDRSTKPARWEVIEARADVVRRIFDLAEQGHGQHAIAAFLNKESVATFGDSRFWHRSTVKKILENSAVVGEFTPHVIEHDDKGHKLRRPQPPVPDYFPKIVAEEVFQNVRAMAAKDGRRNPTTSRSKPVHMLAGIARCGLCGETMTRVYKGARGGKPKLVCTAAKAGASCSYRAVSLEAVEDAIRADVAQLIATAPTGDDSLDAALDDIQTRRLVLSDEINNLVDAIATGRNSRAVQEKLRELETLRDQLETEQDALAEKLAAASKASVERRLAELERLIADPSAESSTINASLRQLMSAVVVNPDDGSLTFRWKHGGESRTMFAWPRET